MIDFSASKNGYNKKEVDLYIKDLNDQLNFLHEQNAKLQESLNIFLKKEKDINKKSESISVALTAAVEKAKQIEQSSNNVYKLKIQQVNLLHAKWENLLNELIEKYPQVEDVENVKKLMQDFKKDIKTTLKEDYRMYSITAPVKTDNDTIRLLLNKLKTHKTEPVKTVKVERKQLSKDMITTQTELNRIEDKAPLIKPICNETFTDGNKDDDLVDKFLRDDEIESNAYSNIITSKVNATPDVNESGFDLKEAINPKEDLDEIMKSFDFFGDDEE